MTQVYPLVSGEPPCRKRTSLHEVIYAVMILSYKSLIIVFFIINITLTKIICILCDWEVQWPHGKCTQLLNRHSRFNPWLGTLHCVLGQDTQLSQCLSPPRNIKWVPANCWGNLTNCREVAYNGLVSIPSKGSRNTPSSFMLQKQG